MARYEVPVHKVWERKRKRFGRMEILPDRRVLFSQERPHPDLEFEPNRYTIVSRGGREYGQYDSTNYAICVWRGRESVFDFVVHGSRVAEGTFPVTPDLRRLRRSVVLMQEAGFGEWVKGGLESTLRSMSRSPHATPSRLRALRKLIDSLEPPPSGWLLPPRYGASWWVRVPNTR